MLQNTMEWIEWRKKGIGASDTPIILGVSPFKTAYQLWENKIGLTQDTDTNFAQKKGHLMENVALEHWSLETGLKSRPELCESEEIPYLRASLDGYCEAAKIIVEAKNVGKEYHERAKKGKVPKEYFYQIQHQLLVKPEAELAHYLSFDGVTPVIVKVFRNTEAIGKIIHATGDFWRLVKHKIAPELSDRDYKPMEKEMAELVKKWRGIKLFIDKQTETLEKLRGEILKKMDHPRMSGSGVKIWNAYRKGKIDYNLIPQLKNVDLEKFRKQGSTCVTFKADQKK